MVAGSPTATQARRDRTLKCVFQIFVMVTEKERMSFGNSSDGYITLSTSSNLGSKYETVNLKGLATSEVQ
ncbi:hypothetical protein EAE99_004159 [Botrytis elliptica]|nr:hypothetical protein EAE99_004159 [Botrytis elliptica]